MLTHNNATGPSWFFVPRSILMFMGCILFPMTELMASHLRAGQITVRRDGCTRTVTILIEAYTNTINTTARFGGRLNFGDGSPDVVIPDQPNIILPELNPDGGSAVGYAFYQIEHTYSAAGTYRIKYEEENRNGGVLNMDNSFFTHFYIETEIRIDPAIGCNSTAHLTVPPIDRACPGRRFTHNPGAFDPNPGDVLTYRLIPNEQSENNEVLHYRDPNDSDFYNGDYNTNSKEGGGGPPIFKIDSLTGMITWDAPYTVGEYNIAFEIIENRLIEGQWKEIGFVRRDMQIIVEDCDNRRPELIIPNDTCVVAGTKLENIKIRATDPDNDDVMIQGYGQIFDSTSLIFPSYARLSPHPGIFQPQPAEARFNWSTVCEHVRKRPYQVVFKATDDPGNSAPNLATFKVWNITVVGPKPVFTVPVVNTSDRSVILKWEPYACQRATQMQIWRKVETSSFDPKCETGMPPHLGFELINTVPVRNAGGPVTSYVDNNGGKGLSPGAKYCYRLVAVYPAPDGSQSLVSEEICVEPFDIDMPLLTKVSVEQTDVAAGEIRLEWIQPPDYEVLPGHVLTWAVRRGTGFTRGADVITVATGLTQLDYLDQGLDTENGVYNYSIEMFDNGVLAGESPIASAVRLEVQAQVKSIKLTWSAVVPWSNRIESFPKHIIKRGTGNPRDEDLIAIDTVDITTGFEYVDDDALDPDETYCYKVETIGGYGNPALPQLIRNFSQKICSMPGDTTPPCKPVLVANVDRCEDYFANVSCDNRNYTNTISWRTPGDMCGNDILHYRVYYSNSVTGQWEVFPEKIRDTVFVDNTLVRSFARCYRVAAVDRTLNISEFSDPICVDNCPHFEMPNVFTPNADGCNDLFSAFREYENGTEMCRSIEDIRSRCPRFVESVLFRVYSRWGNQVFTYDSKTSNVENSILINWDGRNSDNRELSSGVYYWVADVTFKMADPKRRNKTYKGWVHLIREVN